MSDSLKNEVTTNPFSQVIKVIMNKRGILKRHIKDALGVSYETLEKKFKYPELFTGIDRQNLASCLKIPISVVDDIINGEMDHGKAMHYVTYVIENVK